MENEVTVGLGLRLGTQLDRADVVSSDVAVRTHQIVSGPQLPSFDLLQRVAEMETFDAVMRSVGSMIDDFADDQTEPKNDLLPRLIRDRNDVFAGRRVERDGM